MLPPAKTRILVIGGGPAGSYSAAALAREGLEVVVLELAHFPRYHVGESLIPSVRHYLRFIDAERKVADYGFVRKPGSAIKLNQYMQEGYTDFVALGASNAAWNVTRAHFDEILMRHAQECGAKVFEGVRVTDIEFVDHPHFDNNVPTDDWKTLGRPVSASYVTDNGQKGQIEFEYLIDASGRAGIMSTKYLKNRRYSDSLKNVAIWGYWRGTGMYGRGTPRENAPFFEALSDESGWAWFIPLQNGLTSVGIVMDQKQLGVRSRACSSASAAPFPFPFGSNFTSSTNSVLERNQLQSNAAKREAGKHKTSSLAERYLTFLHLAPGVLKLIGKDGTLIRVSDDYSESPSPAKGEGGNKNDKGEQEIPMARSASDFSYSAGRYAGNRWRVIGDAGAFIDPFFSSGVHLACTGALSAAASIAALLRGDCTETEAAEWCHQRIAISYTRFLVVVLSAYKQIRAQNVPVLADIEHDNFDKAFVFLRPLIQGTAEMGMTLTEDEVQRALDFCVNLFSPTTPEQYASVREKLRSLWSTTEDSDSIAIPSLPSVHTPSTPPRTIPIPKTARPPMPPRSFTGFLPYSRQRSTQTDTTPSNTGIREEDDEVKDKDAEKLMDVHAPLVSPRTLSTFLKSNIRRMRSNTMPALKISRLDSPPTSPINTSHDTPSHQRLHTGTPPGLNTKLRARGRSGTVSTVASSTTTLSFSTSLSGTTLSSSMSPKSPLSNMPRGGDDSSNSDVDEIYYDSVEYPSSDHEGSMTHGEQEDASEMKMVLDKVNARRVIQAEHGDGLNGLETEAVAGFVVRLVKGNLGLTRTRELS